MSFVKKAVKKVFKTAKKVVKKVWKPALIIGGTLLTAGMAAPGFAGFAMSSGLGGFLGSVGSTIASGAGALLGTVGLSQSPGLLSPGAFGGLVGGGAGATGGGLIGAGGIGSTPIAGVGSAGFAGGATAGAGTAIGAGASAAGTGIAGAVGKTLSGMFEGPVGKMALFNGISTGVQSYMAAEEASKERKIERRSNFFGGPMRGGSAESGIEFPEFTPPETETPEASQPNLQQNPAFAQGQMPQQPMQTPGILQPGNLSLVGNGQQPVQFMQRPPAFEGVV